MVLSRLLHKSGTFVVVTEGWQIFPSPAVKRFAFPSGPELSAGSQILQHSSTVPQMSVVVEAASGQPEVPQYAVAASTAVEKQWKGRWRGSLG